MFAAADQPLVHHTHVTKDVLPDDVSSFVGSFNTM